MASFEITHIIGSTSIRTALLNIVNTNFDLVSDAFTVIENIINPTTAEATISKMTIERGTLPTTTILSINEASTQIQGNLTVGSSLTTSTATITNALTITQGNVTLSDSTKKLTVVGGTSLQGSFELSNFSTNYLDASAIASYDPGNVSGTNAVLTVSNVHAILLDYSNYDSGGSTNTILTNSLPTTNVPQTIKVVAKIGSSLGTHGIKYTNIAGMTNTQTIQWDADYAVAEFVWVGTEWVIMNLLNAQIVG